MSIKDEAEKLIRQRGNLSEIEQDLLTLKEMTTIEQRTEYDFIQRARTKRRGMYGNNADDSGNRHDNYRVCHC